MLPRDELFQRRPRSAPRRPLACCAAAGFHRSPSDQKPMNAANGVIRHDWTIDQLVALHEMPRLELVGRANAVHRQHHDCQSARDKGSSLFGVFWSSALWLANRRSLGLRSFAGSCFSSGSARWPSQDGIRRIRRPNLTRVLIAGMRPVQEPKRTHLIHRLAELLASLLIGAIELSGGHGRVLPGPTVRSKGRSTSSSWSSGRCTVAPNLTCSRPD